MSPIEAKTVDATTGPIPGIVIRRTTRGSSSASPDDRHVELGELIRIALQFVDQPTDDRFFLLRQRQASQPFLAGLAEQMARVLRDQICMQDRVDTSLGANDLLENAHALSRLAPLPLGVVVGNPDLRQKAAGV